MLCAAENLKHSRGNYTDQHVQRCSQVVGNITKEVSKIVHVDVGGLHEVSSSNTEISYQEEIGTFVKIYKRDKLWDFKAGRQHKSFAGFRHANAIKRPAHLKGRIQSHLRVLDEDYYSQEIHGLQNAGIYEITITTFI